MKKSKEYCEAGNKAAIECESRIQIFDAGYDFAMSQPKHIFDGVAQVGEVRRFEGELVDVVGAGGVICSNCVLFDIMPKSDYDIICNRLTGCDTHNVKYIKRV